jgi:superfamily II DNA or RNA helicase
VVNRSERILLMIDEAHRTQSSDMGDNLFEAFPNATRIAFTGTPLITEQHGTKRTVKRFGEYIDTYKLMDSVEDGATLQILYEGRTADTALKDKHGFDTKFEDLFRERTDEELAAIKRSTAPAGTFWRRRTASGRLPAIWWTTTSITSCRMVSRRRWCAIPSWPRSAIRRRFAKRSRSGWTRERLKAEAGRGL